jgi:uncharacterized protein
MQLKAKDIGEEGVDVDLAVTPAWLEQQVPDAGVRPAPEGLRFHGRVEPSSPSFQEFLVRGKLEGALVTPCSRCLEDATLPVDVDVSVLFVEKDSRKVSGANDEEDDDPALDSPDVLSFQDGVIDLAEELREEILLALPTQVLCREDCKGLCPVCGGNRNQVPCQCEEAQKLAQSKFAKIAKDIAKLKT